MDHENLEPLARAPGEGLSINCIGDNQTVKLTGEQTGGRFTLVEDENPPGTAIPLHYHTREDESFYVLDGTVDFTIGGRRLLALPGTTLFAPRDVPHAWTVIGDRSARMLIMLTPGGADRMFAELASHCGDRCAGGPMPPPEVIAEICGRYGVFFGAPAEAEG